MLMKARRGTRCERRLPLEVAVYLTGHARVPGVESTFTEDVSGRGARVTTVRRWQPNERLTLVSRTGEFRSTARVAYCQALPDRGYAIGVEFLEPKGRWVVQFSASSTLS